MILLLGALFFNLRSFQATLESQMRRDLEIQAGWKAQILSRWQDDLSAALIILAEQKGMREGVLRKTTGAASGDFQGGFFRGVEAACRTLAATFPGVEGLTLRGLDGEKWVGTGVQTDSVVYPEIRMRYRRVRLNPQAQRALERWIVPVRDVNAQPLAFLIADANPAGALKLVLETDSAVVDLVCLEDTSGARLWDSSDSQRIPRLVAGGMSFILEGREYLLAEAKVSGSSWKVCQARDRSLMTIELNQFRRGSAIFAGAGMVLLGLAGLILKKF